MSNNFRKPNTLLDQEKHVIEYTSGQFIFAICIALMVALFCFLAGMVVKATSQPQLAASAPAKDVSKTTEPAPKPAPGSTATGVSQRKEGLQTSPKPEILSSAKPNTPKPASPAPAGEPRSVNLPPLEPDSVQKTAATAPSQKTVTESPKPATPVTSPNPAPAPSAPPPQIAKASESPKKEVASAPPNKAQSSSAEAKDLVPAPRAPEKATIPVAGKSSGGGYTVQLAAFSVADESKAEGYRANLAKNTDLKPEILKSTDGKFVRVVTGAFADRAAAEKARAELAKRGEFSKCFVQRRE